MLIFIHIFSIVPIVIIALIISVMTYLEICYTIYLRKLVMRNSVNSLSFHRISWVYSIRYLIYQFICPSFVLIGPRTCIFSTAAPRVSKHYHFPYILRGISHYKWRYYWISMALIITAIIYTFITSFRINKISTSTNNIMSLCCQ